MRVVWARATLPSTATVRVTAAKSSVTFWWMRLLANRVSDDVPNTAVTTASARPRTCASVRSQAAVACSVNSARSDTAGTVV